MLPSAHCPSFASSKCLAWIQAKKEEQQQQWQWKWWAHHQTCRCGDCPRFSMISSIPFSQAYMHLLASSSLFNLQAQLERQRSGQGCRSSQLFLSDSSSNIDDQVRNLFFFWDDALKVFVQSRPNSQISHTIEESWKINTWVLYATCCFE